MADTRDKWVGPFHRLLVLGESNAYGMCAFRPENEWHQVTANLLRKFQDGSIEVLNRAIPASVISPRCPGYEMSAKPSLLERYRKHGIEARPDLIILSQGLNDMRAGMSVQDYMADLVKVVSDLRQETEALIVLVGIYPQIYGQGVNDPAIFPTFAKGNDSIAEVYNLAMRLIAEGHGAQFVDVLPALSGANWVLDPDCCHLNDLGHVLVGNLIFQVIATHCSGIGAKTLRLIDELEISIANTGGTDTDVEIQTLWKQAAARFGVEL